MTKTFVAINDPVHSLIRNVTRHTPLCPSLSTDQRLPLQYSFREQDLPEAYYSLAVFHALSGLSLKSLRRVKWRVRESDKAGIPARVNYFDAVKLDRRCARDLRLKLKRHGPGLLAGELLCFGTGTLRARNDDPVEQHPPLSLEPISAASTPGMRSSMPASGRCIAIRCRSFTRRRRNPLTPPTSFMATSSASWNSSGNAGPTRPSSTR